MKKVIQHIRQSLSLQLSLNILGLAVAVFIISIGFLFYKSRNAVRQSAIEQVTQVLDNTVHRITSILDEVETATHNTECLVLQDLSPESAAKYSRTILEINPNIFSCSISFEPYYFKNVGKYLSMFSKNNKGYIETIQEGSDEYNYFKMDWHKEPIRQKRAVWLDPFNDLNSEDGTYDEDKIVSYCKPLVDTDGQYIGVISSDISQKKIVQAIGQKELYPNSFCVLIGSAGEIIASSKEDVKTEDINQRNNIVLRQELPNTHWTAMVVCPERDIFKGYNQLIYIVFTIIIFGLLLMLSSCYVIVKKAIQPLSLLAKQTEAMAEGRFDQHLPLTNRADAIGQLQNSFSTMQQAITDYIYNLELIKDETEQHNKELKIIKVKAEEANQKKTAIIQDISHQIRTPLNIIGGFAQVIRDSLSYLDKQEISDITESMLQNSDAITTIVDHLVTSSELEAKNKIECHDKVNCNEICRKAINSIRLRYPDTVTIKLETELPDSLQITTNKESLQKILKELLTNANKFTQSGHITMNCSTKDCETISISVSDSGPGISAKDQEQIFTQFYKLDSFTEGLGLGLPICKQLAEQLGGHLTVDPAYNKGCRFILTLPQ